MPSWYEDISHEELKKMHAYYSREILRLTNPPVVCTIVCLGGLFCLMAGIGAVLYSGLDGISALLIALGCAGSYKWHSMDKQREFASKELDIIEDVLQRKWGFVRYGGFF